MMLSDQFEIKPDCKRVILHVGRDISTGVWSLVMALAVKQNQIAGQMAGIGLLCSQGLSGRIGRSWASVYDPSRSVQIVERGVWNVHFEQPAARLVKTAGCQIS